MAIPPINSSVNRQTRINSSGKPIVDGTFSIVSEVDKLRTSFFHDLVNNLEEMVKGVQRDFYKTADKDEDWTEYAEYLTASLKQGDLVLSNDAPYDVEQEMVGLEYGTSQSAPHSLFRTYIQDNKADIANKTKDAVDRLIPYV